MEDSGGSGSDRGDPGGDPNDPNSMVALLKKKRTSVDKDDEFFQPQRYQEFSREPIIFYKGIDGRMLKWQVRAGEAFKRKRGNEVGYYIPFQMLAQPLGSLTILSYSINIELIKIPDSMSR